MTRHSTLTNPNDLHYAKVRSFTGDPANLIPDFADELIIATDTNKIYRATDTNRGALVELVAANNGGGNAGMDQFYPSDRPTETGKFFYETFSDQLYISVQNFFGAYWWRPIHRFNSFIECSISVNSVQEPIVSSVVFTLVYSPLPPSEIEAADFDFVMEIGAVSQGQNIDLSGYFGSYGRGCYAIAYSCENPDNLLTWTSVSVTNGAIGIEARSNANSQTGLGKKISGTYLYYTGEKSLGQTSLAVSFEVREPIEG